MKHLFICISRSNDKEKKINKSAFNMMKKIFAIGLLTLCAYAMAGDNVRVNNVLQEDGLAEMMTDTVYLQNQNITSSVSYQALCIRVGNHVTTQQTQGDVNVISGTLSLTGNDVELDEGTTIAVGAQLEINN